MFGLIKDVLSIPERIVEGVDDALLDGWITGPRRKREALQRIQELMGDGYTREQAVAVAKLELGE